ncbi:hypothetical protein JOB18_021111 [Solea senegalensis]|uniref:Uncharacterized protein n=1 Tax=Solea senegalensis TaxID=28829 RepID=A0AAV6S9B5_SOLSE|nr:hypothetical protein JOB18_021111 [Solea senegalensis]
MYAITRPVFCQHVLLFRLNFMFKRREHLNQQQGINEKERQAERLFLVKEDIDELLTEMSPHSHWPEETQLVPSFFSNGKLQPWNSK